MGVGDKKIDYSQDHVDRKPQATFFTISRWNCHNKLEQRTYGTPLNTTLFGYHNTRDLLKDIEELIVICGKVFFAEL